MNTDGKIRLGVLGAGTIGKIHLGVFNQLKDDVILGGLADAFRPMADRAAVDFPVERVYDTPDELISDEKIDAVVLGIPNKWHEEYAVKALNAGKHVLLEKPMAIDGKAAKNIVRAQKESRKMLMVAHQMRFESVAQQIKEQVDKGALGRIYNAKTGWWRRKGIPGWGTWFTRMDESGGGPLIDIGVHMLDVALWLMGNPKPVSVFGSTYAEFGPRKAGIGTWGTPDWNGVFDVEDLATALIKMDDGSTLSLEVSWAVNMDTDNAPFTHLMGSEGGAFFRGSSGKLLKEHFDRPMEVDLKAPANDEGSRLRLSRHFVECLKTGKEPIAPAVSGMTNNLILDAIYESSKTGREVKLDYSL